MEELHRRAPMVLRLLITKKSESTRGGQEGEKKKVAATSKRAHLYH